MERISIQDLALSVLPSKRGMKKKDAERFATTLFEVVKEGLASDRVVKIKGLGTFKMIDIDARESINVNTGERVVIESHDRITFTPDSTMKEVVNRPFSQFETVVLNDDVEFDDSPVLEGESDLEPEEDEMENFVQNEVTEEKQEAVEPESIPEPTEPQELTEPQEPTESQGPTEPQEPVEILEPEVPQEPIEISEPAEEESAAQLELFDQTEDVRRKIPLKWWFIMLAACIGSFAGGYYLGKQSDKQELQSPIDEIEEVSPVTDTTKTDTIAKADTLVTIAKEVEEPVAQTAEEPAPIQTEEVVNHRTYALKDARVRTGAYRIVGTDSEVTVRAGETVARVAKRTLGPGMECYIEVYNDITSKTVLKEGQTLKIPKLEAKKIKKKTLTKE